MSSGGKYEGVGDIGRALTGIGASLVKTENKTRYDTQMARAEAQKLRDKNVLDSKLEEHRSSPELWESDFDDWFTNTYEKNVTADVSDPVALRDLQNSIIIDKEVIRNDVLKRAELQDKENSNNAYVSMNLELQNRDFKSPIDLQAASNDYHKSTLEMMKTGDVNGLETPERFVESYDKNWSATTVRFLLQNPDKVNEDGTVDEDYWINHPNEFAENYGLNAAINRPLFTKDEIVDLKKEHSERKKFIETEAKKANEAGEHEIEMKARNFAIEGNWGAGIEEINSGLPIYGVDWHTDALNKYRNAYSIQNQTGVNVYKTTHNPIAFGEMRDRVLAGTATVKDIRADVGPDGYSTTDEAYLIKLLEGDESEAKALEDSAAGKTLIELIEGVPITEEKYDAEGNLLSPVTKNIKTFAEKMGLRWLQDFINNNPGMTTRQKDEEAIRIFNRVNRLIQAGEIEIKAESLPGAKRPEAGSFPGGKGGTFRGRGASGSFEVETGKAKLPKVTSDSDYDKLKSGTEFIDAETGKRYRKP